jgi:hypothetical protein
VAVSHGPEADGSTGHTGETRPCEELGKGSHQTVLSTGVAG